MNPAFLIDFYKVGHIDQYPKDVTQVWSNFTPRSTRVVGQKHVVFFGIGSYTYEYVTRDTYGFAMKATAIRRGVGGPVEAIWKKPVTDEGGKTSHRGIPAVYGVGR